MEDKDFYKEIYEKIGEVMKSKGSNHPDAVQLMSRLNNLYAKNGNPRAGNTGGSVVIPPSIQIELNTIREHLEFRGDISINYDFIEELQWRKQLIADNIRMENTKLRMKGDDGKRFDDLEQFKTYCKYACFQIELLVNCYFNKVFDFNFQNFQNFFSQLKTEKKVPNKWQLKEESSINRVPLELKINLLLDWRFEKPNKQIALKEHVLAIKNVRNKDSHRAAEKSFNASGGEVSGPPLDEKLMDERDFNTVDIWLRKYVDYVSIEMNSLTKKLSQ